jgi:LPS-assembly lipoprotein
VNGLRLTFGTLGLLLLPMLLTACGFHFRQAPDLPPSMRHIYIAAPGDNGSLLRELRRDLASDDTQIMPTPLGATTILSIVGVSHSSRPMALSRTGQPLEYQVTYGVEFSLVVQGATIMEPQTVDLKRNYTYSVTNAIANEEQEQNLEDALSRDVAQFIVYRVVAAARSLSPSLAALPVTTPAPKAASVAVPVTTTTPAPATATPPAV